MSPRWRKPKGAKTFLYTLDGVDVWSYERLWGEPGTGWKIRWGNPRLPNRKTCTIVGSHDSDLEYLAGRNERLAPLLARYVLKGTLN